MMLLLMAWEAYGSTYIVASGKADITLGEKNILRLAGNTLPVSSETNVCCPGLNSSIHSPEHIS